MTVEVNIHEAKTHLSKLLQRVMCGEEVVIANAGTPVAKLVRIEAPLEPRVPGRDAGLIWMADDFDDPLPPEIQKYFEGEGDEDLD